jgi:multidrug resistance protein, MATE family
MTAQESNMAASGAENPHPESYVRRVLVLSWPLVVGMLSYTAMDVADTMFVGWLGTAELAAVGLATTALFFFNSFVMGTLQGVNVVSAQATGAQRPDQALRAGLAGLLLVIPFALLVLGVSLFNDVLFRLLGATAEVQALGADYFALRAWGVGFWFATLAIGGYYQGTGDTRTPMYVNVLANGLNIALDPLLIFGLGPIPAMGVEGAALATIIAQAVGMVTIMVVFLRRTGLVRLRDHRVRWEDTRGVLRLGLPIGMHYAVGIGAFTVFTAMVARLGTAELAAHMIALKIVSVSFLPGHGVAQAASILSGQAVGRREPNEVFAIYRAAMKVGLLLMGLCGVVFFVVPEVLAGVFTTDADTIAIASKLLMIAAVFQLVDATMMVTSNTLNGTGDTRFTMLASMSCAWVVMVPSAYVLMYVFELGPVGGWGALIAEFSAAAVLMTWRLRSRRWWKGEAQKSWDVQLN